MRALLQKTSTVVLDSMDFESAVRMHTPHRQFYTTLRVAPRQPEPGKSAARDKARHRPTGVAGWFGCNGGERLVRVSLAVLLLLSGATADAPPAQAQSTQTTVPSEPQDFRAEADDGQVELTWSAPENNGGSPVVFYALRYAQGASVPDDTQWSGLGGVLTHTVTDLNDGTQYSFELVAVNEEGAGPAAVVQQTTPGVPTVPLNVTVHKEDGGIVLQWSAPEHNGGFDSIGYRMRKGEGASVPADAPWISRGRLTSGGFRGLTNGTLYTFQVRAVNERGEGPIVEVQATPGLPSAPRNLFATAGGGRVELAWNAPADNGGFNRIRYELRHAEGASVPASQAWTDVGAVTTHTVTRLAAGILHTFEVRAVTRCCAGPAAQVQATPGELSVVSVRAEQASVTEGDEAVFRFSRTGSTAESLSVGVNISGHEKIMSAATRALAGSTSPHTTVTFGVGVDDASLKLASEADLVNEGDGEISVSIADSPDYEAGSAGSATVLVEDDDIPEVTLEWISPPMTLVDNVWVGSLVEGQDIEVAAQCSGNTLAPDDGTFGIPIHYREVLNHPVFAHYGQELSSRLPCADPLQPGRGNIWHSGARRFVGPNNGEIEIDLYEQVVSLESLPGPVNRHVTACYPSTDDIRFCPKFTLGEVTSARIEVLNRNPTITVEAVDDEVNEGESARFRLTRIWTSDWLTDETLVGTTTVDYTTAAVGDYVTSLPSGQITFATSVTELIVDIPTVRDGVPGETGQVTLELSAGNPETQSGNIGGHYEVYDHLDGITPPGGNSRIASVRILNNDEPGVEISATALTVPEGDSRTYTVVLETQPTGPVTVAPSVSGSADVTVSPSELTFTAQSWDQAQTVTVSAARDADAANDTATVSHAVSGGGYDSVTAPDVAVTAEDDDERGIEVSATALPVPEGQSRTYTVVLETQPTGPVTVTPSVSGSADVTVSPSELTFTAQTWGRAQTVTVSAAQDADAANDTATVSHAVSGGDYGSVTAPDVAVTAEDDDERGIEVSATALPVPEGDSRTYTVVLETQPTGPVTVTPSVSGSADVTASPAALTFTAQSWGRAQTVTVSAAQDNDVENDLATVSHLVSGADYGSVTAPDVAVTAEDDDERGIEVSATALTVPEGDSRTYTVVLETQPTGPVTVTPSVSGSADVTVSPAALTFTAQTWGRAQTVTVSTAQDADAANDTATVSHAVSGGDYGSVTAPDVAVTAEDDDERGIEVSATALTVPEGDSRTYTVVLETQPTGPVTVTPSVSGSADVTVSPSELTFTTQSWDRAQTVTVSAAQDADAENDTATVSHAVSGGDYGSVTAPDVAVTAEDDDERGIEVSATALTVPEGDSRTYTVVLETQPTGPVTVTPSVSGSADVTVSPSELTFTTQSWDRAQTVTVSAAQDADAENDTATVSHAVSGGDYGSVTAPGIEVAVSDDETPSAAVALTASPGTVDEDAGATTIEVTGTLDGAPRTSATAVTVSVAAGTASTDDFAAVPEFTLTIAAGRSSGTATFVLTPVDDAIDEDDETVRVSGTAQNLTVTAGTVTIEDDDERGIEVSATALPVPEGDSRTYTVALETQPTGPVTVAPSVSGSADVTVSPSELTFTAQSWDRAQTVTVSAAQDADAANDTATVSHAVSGGGYDSVTAPDVAVTAEDDDARGIEVSATALPVPEGDSRTYTVVLESQPTGPVTVTPSVSGSADVTVSPSELTFTTQSWDQAQTVTVSAAQDEDAANDEATVSHTVSGGGYDSVTAPDVAVTAEDDDARGIEVSATALPVPEGGSRTYTVVLEAQPTGPVTVTPSVSGSADVTVSPSELTFTAQSWDRAQTVTVSAAQDADAANDTATVSHAVSGGGYDSVTPPDVAVTAEDDDARGIEVSATALTVPEGDSRTYTVVLETQPTGPVTVTPSVSGSADVTVSPAALTFTAQTWDRVQTVTVSAARDADAANDTATVSHAVSGGGYDSVTPPDVAVTAEDDDARGIEVSATALTVPEGDSRTYTVVLEAQPTGPVTVTPSVSGSADVTVSPAALTFTAQSWDQAQIVTVSAARDADAANDTATVSHAVSGGGYDSVTAPDVAVTVEDDETPSAAVALTASPGVVSRFSGIEGRRFFSH